MEFARLNIDIVALQETRLDSTGSLRERDYTFFWHGKDPENRREYGVGFAVKNTLLDKIEPPASGSKRIITLRLSTCAGPVNFINAYAPTLYSTSEIKDRFYEELSNKFAAIPSTEHLYILGDFNARVEVDQTSWPSCLGYFGTGFHTLECIQTNLNAFALFVS